MCDNPHKLENYMRTIKEILLTEYIGAIVVAVLIADAFTSFVMTFVEQVAIHLQPFRQLPPGQHLSITYSIGGTAIRIAIYLVIAYLLVQWLYKSNSPSEGSLPAADNAVQE
jgi:hypothetical protein